MPPSRSRITIIIAHVFGKSVKLSAFIQPEKKRDESSRFSSEHTAEAHIGIGDHVYGTDTDTIGRIQGIDDLIIADIDTGMTIPDDDIARLRCRQRNTRADPGLGVAGTGKGNTEVGKHILDKTGAVKAGRGCAAPDIRTADKCLGIGN